MVWAGPVSLAATPRITVLFSLPPGTKMVQFPGFASLTYVFSKGYLAVGCPIRTLPDQSLFGGSPRLFAAYHVLHRFSMPRHPLFALNSLMIDLHSALILETFSSTLMTLHHSSTPPVPLKSWYNPLGRTVSFFFSLVKKPPCKPRHHRNDCWKSLASV